MKPVTHQSTREQREAHEMGDPEAKTLCERSMYRVKRHTGICAAVNCPDCKLQLARLVEFVRRPHQFSP